MKTTVGLPDSAVRESRERVKSAIRAAVYCRLSKKGGRSVQRRQRFADGGEIPGPVVDQRDHSSPLVLGSVRASRLSFEQATRNAPADARAYRESASALKERFNRDWWIEDEQFFALALDSDKRQVRALTSNVGHCLACGIIDRERLPAVVGRR